MADRILAPCGIYTITNTVTGNAYVGSSIELATRKYTHFWSLRRGTHYNVKLQRAWNKHGDAALVFAVVEYVSDVSTLLAREQHWIDALNTTGDSGYNIASKAGHTLGFTHSDECRARMSVFQRGRVRAPLSEETRAKIGAANSKAPLAGRLLGAAKRRGRLVSDEFRAKMKAARAKQVMKVMTEETKAKIGARVRAAALAKRIAAISAIHFTQQQLF